MGFLPANNRSDESGPPPYAELGSFVREQPGVGQGPSLDLRHRYASLWTSTQSKYSPIPEKPERPRELTSVSRVKRLVLHGKRLRLVVPQGIVGSRPQDIGSNCRQPRSQILGFTRYDLYHTYPSTHWRIEVGPPGQAPSPSQYGA